MGLGSGEILVILILVLLLFGGDKLPTIARNIGKGISELQKAAREIKREIDLSDDDKPKRGPDNLQG
jgi:sec-independent protein translocase protein TatA